MKRQLHALRLQERKNADKATCKALGTIILDGNRPEDKSGAVGLPPTPMQVMTKVMEEIRKAEKQKAPKPPLATLVARLKRLEHRLESIEIICENHIAKHGEEPSDVTLIQQHARGDYDR